jgi:hypothetical protein
LAPHHITRARIILAGTAHDGYHRIAARHQMHWQTVRLWQQRWRSASTQMAALQREVLKRKIVKNISMHPCGEHG